MCLYPRIIKNRKYTANKKNKGIIPTVTDKRTEYVPVGCGKCMECMKQKANHWKVRLFEEIRTNHTGKFVTLTFSNDQLEKLKSNVSNVDNEQAVYAVRHFLENWRKETGKSVKHWLITELGHKGTERIHIHGLLFTDDIELIKKKWIYGWVYIGKYVNEKTINYIVKYVTKIDTVHKNFTGKILCSPGIGANYLTRLDAKRNTYKEENTKEDYITKSGRKIGLPIYYRNKIYTEEERENLWINKLNKQERWILGQKVDISKGEEEYYKLLTVARQKNQRLGYGKIAWKKEEYEKSKAKLMPKIDVEKNTQNEVIITQHEQKTLQFKINEKKLPPESERLPEWLKDGKAFE